MPTHTYALKLYCMTFATTLCLLAVVMLFAL